MGSKYTIQAGTAGVLFVEYKTEYLVIALWKYLTIKIDKETIYWKILKCS